MKSINSMKMYCFSPPVMLATFTIEIIFMFYVLWRYQLSTTTRLIALVLGCLAGFQATEYLLCGGMGVDGGVWSRLGYSSITMLPPLGVHLAHAISGKKSRVLVPAAYASAAGFIGYFVFGIGAISGHTCYANYAVFNTHSGTSMLYGLYYYGWLITGTTLSYQFALNAAHNIRRALFALSAGYIAFMLPTTAVNLIDPSTLSGIPSIMCGFAVILAFVLVGKVAPESVETKVEPAALRALLLKLRP